MNNTKLEEILKIIEDNNVVRQAPWFISMGIKKDGDSYTTREIRDDPRVLGSSTVEDYIVGKILDNLADQYRALPKDRKGFALTSVLDAFNKVYKTAYNKNPDADVYKKFNMAVLQNETLNEYDKLENVMDLVDKADIDKFWYIDIAIKNENGEYSTRRSRHSHRDDGIKASQESIIDEILNTLVIDYKYRFVGKTLDEEKKKEAKKYIELFKAIYQEAYGKAPDRSVFESFNLENLEDENVSENVPRSPGEPAAIPNPNANPGPAATPNPNNPGPAATPGPNANPGADSDGFIEVPDVGRVSQQPNEPSMPLDDDLSDLVVKTTAWEWVKDHKKEILIALGLTALAVSLAIVVAHVIPALQAHMALNSLNAMSNNAALWHHAAADKLALHKLNVRLSGDVFNYIGVKGKFIESTGKWLFNGKELAAFAADQSAIAAAGTKFIPAALGGLIGGAKLLDVAARSGKKSDKYKELVARIAKLKDGIESMSNADFITEARVIAEEIQSVDLSAEEIKRLRYKLSNCVKKWQKKAQLTNASDPVAITPGPAATPNPNNPGPAATPDPNANPGPAATPDPNANPGPAATPDPNANPGPAATPNPNANPGPAAPPSPAAPPDPAAPQNPDELGDMLGESENLNNNSVHGIRI